MNWRLFFQIWFGLMVFMLLLYVLMFWISGIIKFRGPDPNIEEEEEDYQEEEEE